MNFFDESTSINIITNYIKKHKLTIPSEINIGELLTHEKFLHEVASSAIVITDGGSVQEECYFLGKKTLIWRKETEREYALADNMSAFNGTIFKINV